MKNTEIDSATYRELNRKERFWLIFPGLLVDLVVMTISYITGPQPSDLVLVANLFLMFVIFPSATIVVIVGLLGFVPRTPGSIESYTKLL